MTKIEEEYNQSMDDVLQTINQEITQAERICRRSSTASVFGTIALTVVLWYQYGWITGIFSLLMILMISSAESLYSRAAVSLKLLRNEKELHESLVKNIQQTILKTIENE